MQSSSLSRLCGFPVIALAALLAVSVAGCPPTIPGSDIDTGTNDQTGDGGDPAGQPVPTDGVELEISIEGQGTVEQQADGNTVTLTALPEDGWEFDGWLGTTVSNLNPLTIIATDTTSIGARFTPIDTDNDGVADTQDQCPGTASGADLDTNGCAASQLDSDGDGVSDDVDVCPGFDDDVDTDADGIPNGCDDCPSDPDNDIDDDGICGNVDNCPNDADNDADNDGVCGDVDQCADTPAGTIVDDEGCPRCGNGQIDSGEECDDGNATPCDGCNATCQLEPANDCCANPTSANNRSTPFTTDDGGAEATTDGPDEPTCNFDESGDRVESDIWFCYEASCTGTATADLCDSDFDTRLAVYSGCACPTSNPIACGDDECGTDGLRSKATFTVTDGDSYLIRIGGFNGLVGSGTLTIECSRSGCLTNAECDDGAFCNGTETCAAGTCVPGSNPCPDDGSFCNGSESCDETADSCVSSGNPCAADETCDEQNDTCEVTCTSDADCDDGIKCTLDLCNLTDNTCSNDQIAGCCASDGDCPTDTKCEDHFCDTANNMCDSNVTPDCCEVDANCPTDTKCEDHFCDTVNNVCESNVTPDCCESDDDCGVICESCDFSSNTCQAIAGCCVSDDDCHDGFSCTDDICGLDRTCVFFANSSNCDDDGLFCNGPETCDPMVGDPVTGCSAGPEPCDDGVACTDDCDEEADECIANTPNDANCDDGLFCNGSETCDPMSQDSDLAGCVPGSDPCLDDGVSCTDDCDEEADECIANTPNDANCDDDGLFCNGSETCNPVLDCVLTGSPCLPGDSCNEDTDMCESQPATWVSTQLLFLSDPDTFDTPSGYVSPDSYELDENRDLVIAHLGLDEDELGSDLRGEVISIMPEVPLGEPTETYKVERDAGGGTTETVVQTVTINTFNLTIAREGETFTATWTFDFIVTRSATGGAFGPSETSQQFIGSRSGNVSADGMQIFWTSVKGIRQNCDLLDDQDPCRGVCFADRCVSGANVGDDCTTDTDCDIPLTDTFVPPGTWTRTMD